ncbi:cache domain-containing protein [Vibrio sinaloensis]|nr:cache domain-containing protein [Vibrio sinaloensis]
MISLAEYYYNQRQILGEETAKQQALKAIEAIRYEGNNYFWIVDQQTRVVQHPLKPELNGKTAKDFTDGAGKHHWQEMVAISNTAAQKGFLDYRWKSPQGALKDKISYVQLFFLNGDGLLGLAFLVSDIQEAFYALAIKETVVALILTGLLFAMGYVISNNILTPLEKNSSPICTTSPRVICEVALTFHVKMS